ncbi:hypothetical protein PMAYCL1PPCAC_11486, partial [Pristionchus mayeri]
FQHRMIGLEVANGILGTSVTWTEFERQLRSALGTEARLGPNKSVIDIGEGNGYASCCGLVTCDWQGATTGEKLPLSVVIKIPSIIPLKRVNDALPEGQKWFDYDEEGWAGQERQLINIHNTEVATYKFFEEFEGLKIPSMFFGKAALGDEKDGLMCLEYIKNTSTMSFHEKNSVDQVKQIARALGKIQACSLKKENTASELQKDMFKNMAESFPLDTFHSMFNGILAIDKSEKTKDFLEKIEPLVDKYYGSNLPTTIHRQMEFRPVLVNGDLHTGNVLIDKDTGDLAALIDWQETHFGVGVEDLHRLALSALTTEQRRASMPILIEEMYESLVENLDGVESPYTLEILLHISDLLYPQCAFYLASGAIAMLTKTSEDTKLTETDKAARVEVMLDKIIGTLEDIVVADENNKKHMENLKLID